MKNLKIGLLVDNLNVNDFNSELLKILEKNNLFKIETIIINKLEKKDIKFYLNEYSFLKIRKYHRFPIVRLVPRIILLPSVMNYNVNKRNFYLLTLQLEIFT